MGKRYIAEVDYMLGKYVQLADAVEEAIGHVKEVAPGMRGWFVVEWQDGSRKRYPRRALVIVKKPKRD